MNRGHGQEHPVLCWRLVVPKPEEGGRLCPSQGHMSLVPGHVALKKGSRGLEETLEKVPGTWPQGRVSFFVMSGDLYEFTPFQNFCISSNQRNCYSAHLGRLNSSYCAAPVGQLN